MVGSSMAPETRSAQVASLYEAAIAGNVDALNELLEQHGEVILHRVSLTSCAETPLHLAALMGHLEFTKRLLVLRPQLTSEQDSDKCTPLHLAAANDQNPVVKELLRANGKACLIQDQEGRVPLHLAAMRGRVQVARELVKSAHGTESVKIMVDDGDTVLHLCVKYNHLDVLKVVLGSISNKDDLLMMTDSQGYTILHLAVMLKQIKTVRFLLESSKGWPKMLKSSKVDLYDVLSHSPKDFKTLEIREILVAAGLPGIGTVRKPLHKFLASEAQKTDGHGSTEETSAAQTGTAGGVMKSWKDEVWRWVKLIMDYKGDWMNDTRGSLMMVASIISTVTFQAAIAPPGGIWQEDNTTSKNCTDSEVCYAGTAVFAQSQRGKYRDFLKYDMIAFTGSVIVMFLLISGFPLSNKFCLWILSLFMSITITFLGVTFIKGVFLVIPEHLVGDNFDIFRRSIYGVSGVVIGIVGLCLLIRLCYWVKGKKFITAWNKLLELRSTMSKHAVNGYARWRSGRTNSSRNFC